MTVMSFFPLLSLPVWQDPRDPLPAAWQRWWALVGEEPVGGGEQLWGGHAGGGRGGGQAVGLAAERDLEEKIKTFF